MPKQRPVTGQASGSIIICGRWYNIGCEDGRERCDEKLLGSGGCGTKQEQSGGVLSAGA